MPEIPAGMSGSFKVVPAGRFGHVDPAHVWEASKAASARVAGAEGAEGAEGGGAERVEGGERGVSERRREPVLM